MPFGGVPQFSKGQEANCIVPCQIVKEVWNQEWRAIYFRTWYLKGVGDVSMFCSFHQLNSQGRASHRYHDDMWHGENVMGRNSWRSAETLRFAWKTSQPHRKSSDDLLWQGWAWFSVVFMVLDLEDYCIYTNLYKSFCPHLLVSYRFLHGTAKPEILHPLMMPLSPTPRITRQRNPMRSWAYQWEGGQSWDLCLHVIRKFGSHWWYPQQKSMVLLESLPEDALFGCTCKLPLGSSIDSTAILQQISMELRSGLPGPMWPRLEP